jgi:hypothetical protein
MSSQADSAKSGISQSPSPEPAAPHERPWRSAWQDYVSAPPAARPSAIELPVVLAIAVIALATAVAFAVTKPRTSGVMASLRMVLSGISARATGHSNTAVYFGRKLEPRGHVVLHGAGQTDDPSFRAYSVAVSPAKPMLYMTYVDLKDDLPAFFAGLGTTLQSYPDYLVPQIGLSLNAGQATTHYEAQVADGSLDSRLAQLCTGLNSLKRPVYLRIGYEFNGQWNGYQPEPYIAAFRRIVVALRACSPETAAVWDFAADGAAIDYMRFYPGDGYVDWWGINLFAEESLTSAATRHFLADALGHKFPVMIGESTPRGHPVTEGQRVIDGWYRPYFELLRTTPQIKAFCYISWDWRQYPQWADWGDARIEDNPVVLAFYRGAVGDKLYQPAVGEAATRALLGLPARLPRR